MAGVRLVPDSLTLVPASSMPQLTTPVPFPPVPKVIEQAADVLAFTAHHLGVTEVTP